MVTGRVNVTICPLQRLVVKLQFTAMGIVLSLFLGGTAHSDNGTVTPTVTAVFTLPECDGFKYPVEISRNGGGMTAGPFGNVYCDGTRKYQTSTIKSELMTRLEKALAGKQINGIDIAAYYIDDADFAEWVCGLPFIEGAMIRIFYQTWFSGQPHVSNDFYGALKSCKASVVFIPVGCDLFDQGSAEATLGRKCMGKVSIMHAKIGRFVLEEGDTVVFTGSGNLNKSLYTNIDDWLIHELPVKDSQARRFECIFSSLLAHSTHDPLSSTESKKAFENCVESITSSADDQGLSMTLTPFAGIEYFNKIVENLEQAEEVMIASQFLDDRRVVAAIQKNSTGKFRIVLDDDNYWAQRNGTDTGYANGSRAQLLSALAPKANVEIRFSQTNHHGSAIERNMLHTRIVIVRRSGIYTVHAGSAHLRQNSFIRNLEVQYEINAPSLTESYRAFFESLWARSLQYRDMPLLDVPAKP